MSANKKHTETRHLVIYGYTRAELLKVMKHFEKQLHEFVKVSIDTNNLVTTITLTGVNSGMELLRFQMNKYHRSLGDIFARDTVTTENKTISQVLGDLLVERELTVSTAESCTGGAVAHSIVMTPGSSRYFRGSVVSYSNDIKSKVLKVPQRAINTHGAVSKEVVEGMVTGVCKMMHTDCGIATSGIAGPDGGTLFKPVGTVWIAVKYGDRVVSECAKFQGNRSDVIEGASNHAIIMLINLLRNTYEVQEDFNDE